MAGVTGRLNGDGSPGHPPPGDWAERAACRGMDTNLFYPEKEGLRSTAQVKVICQRCPVQLDCLEYATRWDEPGVWGGRGQKARRKLRKAVAA